MLQNLSPNNNRFTVVDVCSKLIMFRILRRRYSCDNFLIKPGMIIIIYSVTFSYYVNNGNISYALFALNIMRFSAVVLNRFNVTPDNWVKLFGTS